MAKELELDFDDVDDMVELAKTSPAMRDSLEQLQKALDQAQVVYELAKPPEPPEEKINQATVAARMQKIMDEWTKQRTSSIQNKEKYYKQNVRK